MIEDSLHSAFSCCDFEYDHFEQVLDKDNCEYMFLDILDQEAYSQIQQKNRQSETNEDQRVEKRQLIVQSKKKTIQKQKCKNHLKNNRKNKEQREQTRKIISHAKVYSVPHRNKGKKRKISINSAMDMKTNGDKPSAGCQNKNLMSFAIRPHLTYIQEKKGLKFIKNDPFLAGLLLRPQTAEEKAKRLAKLQRKSKRQNGYESMRQEYSNSKTKVPENLNVKDTATLEHFNVLYNDPNLTEVWRSFFQHKVLFRQLMISRVAPNYKFMFMSQLQRFEENFKRGSFKFLTSACQYDEEKPKHQ